MAKKRDAHVKLFFYQPKYIAFALFVAVAVAVAVA